MVPRSRPIIILQSILAGVTALLGGAALASFISADVIGLANLVVAAITVGLGVYLSGTNVQDTNVAVAMHDTTTPVAGAASPIDTGKVLAQNLTVEQVTPPPTPVDA